MSEVKRPRSEERDDDDGDYDRLGTELISLVRSQNAQGVRDLLKAGAPAAYQVDDTGASALMVAAGLSSLELVKLLLEHGAPWNALDRCGRCAGEYAVDAGAQDVVDTLVTAGVTAELLFGAADRNAKLAAPTSPGGAEPSSRNAGAAAATTLDSSGGAGGGGAGGGGGSTEYDAHFPAAPGQYLADRGVRYDGDRLLDSADDAVMMAWEAPLMEAHADVLCAANLEAFGDLLAPLGADIATSVLGPGGRSVLNIGFGMGIVDGALQRRGPGHHTIVEAHPAVYAQMERDGWLAKPNVTVRAP